MQFHKTLNTLVENISKLQFSTQHDMKPTTSMDDESTFDVVTRASCNGMFTEEYKIHLQNITSEVVKQANENLIALGTHFQREILEIIMHTDRLQNCYFKNEQYQGIEETILGFDLFQNEMYELGMIDYGNIETRIEPKEEFYFIVINQLELLKNELSEFLFNSEQERKPIQKLQWYVKPAVLGSLLCELEKKRWIGLPKNKGNVSYSAFARQCNDLFEFQGEVSSLEKVLNRSTKPWSGANMFDFEYAENL